MDYNEPHLMSNEKTQPIHWKKGQLLHCWLLVHSSPIIPTFYDYSNCVSTSLYYKIYSTLQL